MQRLLENAYHAISRIRRFYFSFDGLIGRSGFWLGLLSLVACDPLFLIAIVLSLRWLNPIVLLFLGVAAIVYPVVAVWALLALSVKRLRDLDKRVSWLFLYYGVPLTCQLMLAGVRLKAPLPNGATLIGLYVHPVMPSARLSLAENALSVLCIGVVIWTLVELGVRRSGGYLFGRDAIGEYGPE